MLEEGLPEVPGIYRIVNKANLFNLSNLRAFYVGQARTSIKTRIASHESALNTREHPNSYMQADWFIDGKDSFIVEVVETVRPADFGSHFSFVRELNKLETGHIAKHRRESLYNVEFVYLAGRPGELLRTEQTLNQISGIPKQLVWRLSLQLLSLADVYFENLSNKCCVSMSREDFIQAGYEGILKALPKYDAARSKNILWFLVLYIRSYMSNLFYSNIHQFSVPVGIGRELVRTDDTYLGAPISLLDAEEGLKVYPDRLPLILAELSEELKTLASDLTTSCRKYIVALLLERCFGYSHELISKSFVLLGLANRKISRQAVKGGIERVVTALFNGAYPTARYWLLRYQALDGRKKLDIKPILLTLKSIKNSALYGSIA